MLKIMLAQSTKAYAPLRPPPALSGLFSHLACVAGVRRKQKGEGRVRKAREDTTRSFWLSSLPFYVLTRRQVNLSGTFPPPLAPSLRQGFQVRTERFFLLFSITCELRSRKKRKKTSRTRVVDGALLIKFNDSESFRKNIMEYETKMKKNISSLL